VGSIRSKPASRSGGRSAVSAWKQRAEFERKACGAYQLAIAAEFVECSEPAAERSGVLIPADARVVFEKLRRVSAEQMVRLHGERSQAIARTGELHGFGRGMGHNARPERLLLKQVQHHAAVARAFIPRAASETLPIPNVWSGPRGQPFGAAGAMKGQWRGIARRVRWR
jgi:hypothetical protein